MPGGAQIRIAIVQVKTASSRRRVPARVPTSKTAVAAVVLAFGASVVVVPGALNRFVFGKLAVAAAGAGIAAFCHPAGRLRRDVRIVLALGAAVLLIGALVSAQPIAGVLGRSPRYEGVFVLAAYVAMAWSGARLLGPERDEAAALVALRTLVVVVCLIAFFAVLEAAGLRPLSSDVARPGSLLGNASDEGAVGVLALGPLALVVLRRRDLFLAVGVGAAVTVTVLSASRGAIAAMVLELVLVGIAVEGRRAVAATVVGLLALSGFVVAVPATRDRVLGTSPLARHTVTGREMLWRESLSLDSAHLALGVGPSNFKSAIVAEHDREWQTKVGPQDPPDSPHSLPLQALSAGGLPLLLLLIVLSAQVVVVGGRTAWRLRRTDIPLVSGAFVSLIGYGVAMFTGFTSPAPTLLGALLLGVVLSSAPGTTGRSVAPRLVATGLGALSLVFLSAAIAEIPLRHAIVDVSRGDVAGAQDDLDAVRVLRPWDVDLPDLAAHAFVTYGLATGDATSVADASKWLSRVPGELRRDEQVELDRSSVDEADHDYAAAEDVLHAVLMADRDDPAVLLQLGIVEAEAGTPDLAARAFRAAAMVVPDDPGPWQDLASLYQSEGREGAAAEASAKARSLAARR